MSTALRRAIAIPALLALFLTTATSTSALAAGDTLIGPFTAGMSLVEADTIASSMRLRWIGRDIHFAGDSALSLYEARDTSVRGVLVYGLTFENGRLHQVELYRSASPDDPVPFGDWLMTVMRSLVVSDTLESSGVLDWSERSGALAPLGAAERRCRSARDGSAITTLLHLRGDAAIIIVCAGTPRVGCQRC